MRLAGTLVLVLCVGVFAGTAYAGNENGNGNGNGGNASPGNSANAPGQVKKEEPAAAPPGAAPATAPAPVTPAAEGVKPSNDTAKDTYEEAASDKTKLYGNGRNAGEIAVESGAGQRTVLHGPGNSQPHKTSPCSGGHEVDVHALKAHSRRGPCGGPSPAPAPTPATPPGTVTQQSGSSAGNAPQASPAAAPAAVAPPHDPAGQPAAESGTQAGGSQGILSLTGQLAEEQLPFTGLRLSLAALVGLTLLLSGLAIRKFVVCVESGHEHPDRAGHRRGGPAAAVRSRTGR
jgi:hypothetical protein